MTWDVRRLQLYDQYALPPCRGMSHGWRFWSSPLTHPSSTQLYDLPAVRTTTHCLPYHCNTRTIVQRSSMMISSAFIPNKQMSINPYCISMWIGKVKITSTIQLYRSTAWFNSLVDSTLVLSWNFILKCMTFTARLIRHTLQVKQQGSILQQVQRFNPMSLSNSSVIS